MSLPRHKLVDELHKFTRLIRAGSFDPYSDGVTEVISVAAAMLADDGSGRRGPAIPSHQSPTEAG